MEEEIEEWKVVNFYTDYLISSNGIVIKRVTNKVLKQSSDRDGYKLITLFKDGKGKMFRVHRLVCSAFHLNFENKPLVNHKDGKKDNNKKSNLEWCTPQENNQHALRTGLVKTGIHSPSYGKLNSQYGKVGGLNNFAKKVINTETGEIFGSIKEAADSINMKISNLSDRLCMRTKNNTKFQYYTNE